MGSVTKRRQITSIGHGRSANHVIGLETLPYDNNGHKTLANHVIGQESLASHVIDHEPFAILGNDHESVRTKQLRRYLWLLQ